MVVEVNSRSKTLYKVQLYLLKVIPMVMAFICLLNSTLSYFDIDIPLLSYIASNSILTLIFYMYLLMHLNSVFIIECSYII